MDIFVKTTGAVLIALIFYLVIAKQQRDVSTLLTIFVCCAIFVCSLRFLEPILDFLRKLETIGSLDNSFVRIILQSVGIGLLSEITGTICADAGNGALGKTLHILAGVVILWISIPLFERLIELVEEILISV